jgi:predicted amidohydrolase
VTAAVTGAVTEAVAAGEAAPAAAALRVALGEYDIGWQDPDASLARAESVVARAAGAGARLVVLPEMCATGFTMAADAWAEPLDGPSATRLAAAAARHQVWVVAGLAARPAPGEPPVNVAAVFDPAGALRAAYRKRRLFAYAGEHASYAPGRDPVVVDVDGVRVCPLVCYDLRFPELFREVARDVDAFVLIANWPAARAAHWEALTRARAIENLAYLVAVNRVGEGGGIAYAGGSVAYGPWGDPLPVLAGAPASVDLDPAVVRDVRSRYPFLDDMEG